MNPKLSVRLLCYNQQKYIAQAIEGILMQKVNFPIEIVIGDDLSTDKTHDIITNYQKKHPNIIKILERKTKLGWLPNFANAIENCSGDYIALLDGDDYWTDPHKLQKQVDFLDVNPEYALCFTSCTSSDEYGNVLQTDILPQEARRNLNQTEILTVVTPPILTVVFRRNLLPKKLPSAFHKSYIGDIFMFGMLTLEGDAAYINYNTANYRVHSSGIWSKKTDEHRFWMTLKSRKTVLKNVELNDRTQVIDYIHRRYESLFWMYFSQKRVNRFIRNNFALLFFDLCYFKFFWIRLNLELLLTIGKKVKKEFYRLFRIIN